MNGFLSDVTLENLPMITYIKFDLEMREQMYLFLLGGTEHKPSSNGIVVFKLYNSRIKVGFILHNSKITFILFSTTCIVSAEYRTSHKSMLDI